MEVYKSTLRLFSMKKLDSALDLQVGELLV